MFDKLTWSLAFRYFNSRQSSSFVSFITIVSIIGITLGTAILIIVLSVLNGFKTHIEHKLLYDQPHIIISGNGINNNNLDYTKNVISNIDTAAVKNNLTIQVYPLLKEQILLKNSQTIMPVNMVSIDDEYNGYFNKVNTNSERDLKNLKIQKIDQIEQFSKLKTNQILVSNNLAEYYGLTTGDKLILAAPVLQSSIVGPTPRFKRFIVAGVFDRTDYNSLNYNQYLNFTDIIMSYDTALSFLNKNKGYLSGLYLYLSKPLASEVFKQDLFSSLNSNQINIQSWYDYSQTLFKAIKLERTAIVLLLLIIITVAGFNLISGLYIQVSEKQKDMAILRTFGLLSKQVSAIFVLQGLIIGLFGCALGVFFGVLLSYNLNMIFLFLQKVKVLDTENMFFNAIINQTILISPNYIDIMIITVSAIFICLLATIIPASRASKIIPVEALKND